MTTQQKQTKDGIQSTLNQIGFDKKHINRALNVYEKHYPIYDVDVVQEIIYRLTVKDKLQIYQKLNKTIFDSRISIQKALESMDLHDYYINIALKQYEMAQSADYFHYDMEAIIEIIMQLRADHTPQRRSDVTSNVPSNVTDRSETDGIVLITTSPNEEKHKLTEHKIQTPEGSAGDTEHDMVMDEVINSIIATEKRRESKHSKNKQNEENRNKQQIENIEHEIISTEKSYYDGLNVLLNELILPIFENKYVDKKYYKKIVSTIPAMIEFHEDFLTELNTSYNSKYRSLANIFNKYILQNEQQFIEIYLKFIADYNDILDLFGNKLYGNKLLDQFCKKMRKQKKSLLNYLILPIQRIPRYILLLKDLKKYTNRRHSDFTNIDNAINTITSIAETINSQQRKNENIAQCLQIQESLHGLKYPIFDETNNRKFEAKFIFIEKQHNVQREFYVFNDIVIITNMKRKVKHILDVRAMDIKRETNVFDGFVEFTLITGITKPMVFRSECMENVTKIQQLIEVNRYDVWAQDILEANNGSIGSLRNQLARQLAVVL